MTKNDTREEPKPETKKRYAETLKILKTEFWDVMKRYSLKSKLGSAPDFEQISHHIKEHHVELMAELGMVKEYWWEVDGEYYRPNTQNLKNFKPASGLLHHFYAKYIHDKTRFNEVRDRSFGPRNDRYRTDPNELDQLVEELSPFKENPESIALLVMPHHDHNLRGTYALCKKITGQKLFIRPERKPTRQPGGDCMLVTVDHFHLNIPISRALNYGAITNGLALFGKEEKEKTGGGRRGGGDAKKNAKKEFSSDIPGKLRVPNGQPIEFMVHDLNADFYDFPAFRIFPVRSLLPPAPIAGIVDYGSLWAGCFAPFIHQSVSVDRFLINFEGFPEDAFNFFFRPHLTNQFVSEEDYVKFMSWFANFDDGVGYESANAAALYHIFKREGIPFTLRSYEEELKATQKSGVYSVRFSGTRPECLTIDVVKMNAQQGAGVPPFSTVGYRVRVQFFTRGVGHRSGVRFSLQDPNGNEILSEDDRLGGILERIKTMAGVPSLEAFAPGEMVEKVLYLTYGQNGGGGVKRKVTETGFCIGGNSVPPPLRESSFNLNLDDFELSAGFSGNFLLPGNSLEPFDDTAHGPPPPPGSQEVQIFGNSIPATVPGRSHSLALDKDMSIINLPRCHSLDLDLGGGGAGGGGGATASRGNDTFTMEPPITKGCSDPRKYLSHGTTYGGGAAATTKVTPVRERPITRSVSGDTNKYLNQDYGKEEGGKGQR